MRYIAPLFLLCLAACSGGNSGAPPPPPPPPQYSVGGAVSGLASGTSLSLTNSGKDTLVVAANGTFSFSTAISSGSAYAVSVSAQPSNPTQSCTISNGTGTVGSGPVTNITVACVTNIVLSTTTIQTAENAATTQQLVATDISNIPVMFAKTNDPKHGSVTISASGVATYTPAAFFYGTDTFTVSLTDSSGALSSALVTATVTYVNYPPVAHDDQLSIPSATTNLSILANDENPNSDLLTVAILTQPRGGTVSVQNNTSVTFQPEKAFAGPTSFTYSITNPSGSSSQATVHLVVGDFPGIVFLADETLIGTPEIHFFDGFKTVRVSTPLQTGASIQSFTMAPDGRHLAYIVMATSGFSQVLTADITNPGAAQLIYTGFLPLFTAPSIEVTFNEDASYVMIADHYSPSGLGTTLVQTATGAGTALGASNPNVLQQADIVFNPVNNEFYLEGQVGGSPPPMSGTGFETLFFATTAAPDPLVQIGTTYSSNGSGSGIFITPTPDGRRVVHAAVTYSTMGNLTTTFDLLVNDRVTNSETYLYRPFGVLELQLHFDMNFDGSGVCFSLNQLPANGSLGPAQVWVADPRAPGSAVVETPVADQNTDCRWASDGKTLVYLSENAAPVEPWVVNTGHPGVVSRLREPLTSNEQLLFYDVARKAMNAVAAVFENNSTTTNFFMAAIDAPGTSTGFYSSTAASVGSTALDARGTSIQLLVREPVGGSTATINRLHWVSTQINNYDLTVSRPDAASGVVQAAFVPE